MLRTVSVPLPHTHTHTHTGVIKYAMTKAIPLSNHLRSDIQRGITKRLMEDPNFDKKKYPNTCNFFEIPDEEPGVLGLDE